MDNDKSNGLEPALEPETVYDEQKPKPGRDNRKLIIGGGAIVVVILLVIGLFWWSPWSGDSSDDSDGVTVADSQFTVGGTFKSQPKPAWTTSENLGVPVADDGQVVLLAKPGSGDKNATGLRIKDGTTAWTATIHDLGMCAPVLVDGKSACRAEGDKVVFIDMKSGAISLSAPLPGLAELQVIDGQLYTGGTTVEQLPPPPPPKNGPAKPPVKVTKVWVAKGTAADPVQAWRVTWPESEQCGPGFRFNPRGPLSQSLLVNGIVLSMADGHRISPAGTVLFDTGPVITGPPCAQNPKNPWWGVYEPNGKPYGRVQPAVADKEPHPGMNLSGTATFILGRTIFDAKSLAVIKGAQTQLTESRTIGDIAVFTSNGPADGKQPTAGISIKDGRELWSNPDFLANLVDRSRVIGLSGDGVSSLDLETGKQLWHVKVGTGPKPLNVVRVGQGFAVAGADGKTTYFAP